MKRIFYTLIIWCLSLSATAAPVSRNKALQLASNFLSHRGIAVSNNLSIAQTPAYAGNGSHAQHLAPLYVVNNNGHGFVIVAGDDNADPVLGYSLEGNLDSATLSDNIAAWLSEYELQIEAASKAEPYTAPAEWTAVEPLLTTQWNQVSPYNALCPFDDGNQALTGCVATAMAQIMRFWQWPVAETAEIPGYNMNDVDYDALPPVVFDWASMTDTYGDESTPEQKEAVAKLMLYAGHSVEMSYGANSSTANTYKASSAFSTCFGYDSHVQNIFRTGFTTDEWNGFIYNEIAKGHPVLYAGQSARANNHAFVCDGYDGQGFFHINWGFGGAGNGWFRLQALNLQERRTDGGVDLGGYTFYQKAIIGIQPPSDDFVVVNDPFGDRLECDSVRINTAATVPYNPEEGINGVSLFYRLYSEVATRTDFGWALGLYKGDELLHTRNLGHTDFSATSSLRSTVNITNFAKNLEDGSYRLILLSRLYGTTEWLECFGTERHYVDVTIADGNCTVLAVNEPAPMPVLTVESVSSIPLFQEEKGMLHVVVANNDELDYKGPLYMFLDGTAVACEYAAIDAHAKDSVDFFFKAGKAGEVSVGVATDRDGYNCLATSTGYVNERELFSQINVQYSDAVNKRWLGCPLNASVVITHGGELDFSNVCSVVLSSEGTTDIVAWQDTLSLYPSGRRQIEVQVGEEDLVYDKQYVLRVLYSDGVEVARTDSFLLVEAVPYWKAGGVEARAAIGAVPEDALAIDLTGVAGREGLFQPNENPNTIYYVGGGRLSAAFRTCNCVVNGHISKLQLTENFDFFAPVAFTADEASYDMTPQVGTDGHGGWFSMVLPYNVDEVCNLSDNRFIDWFRNSEDSLKDFWVKEFTLATDDGKVAFSHAAEWLAGVPYIVAVPDASYAPDYVLQGKQLRFSGHNVEITSAEPASVVQGDYVFQGTYAGNARSAYFLNHEGTAFTYTDSVAAPFTCWILYQGEGVSPQRVLNIFGDSILAVNALPVDGNVRRVPVYTPAGCKVAEVDFSAGIPDLSSLPRGIFIIKGRKYVKTH